MFLITLFSYTLYAVYSFVGPLAKFINFFVYNNQTEVGSIKQAQKKLLFKSFIYFFGAGEGT